MCFNQTFSFGFAGLGLLISVYVHHSTKNWALTSGVFFFFLMEFLQGIQYFYIDQCENPINQVLTVLGFLHICLQPYFTHVINSALTKSPISLAKFEVVKRLCLAGGALLFARFVFAYLSPSEYSTMKLGGECGASTEWLRGDKLCTYKGNLHLAWSVPMADPTYYFPGAGIHSFLMFAPFFVLRREMWIQGIVLFATGPMMAAYLTPNLQEQASIWCFFSIAQIAVMLFIIRGKLSAGKDGKAVNGNGKEHKVHNKSH